jgi:hypothetical protein
LHRLRSIPVAVVVGVVGPALIGVAWFFVWMFLGLLLVFLTCTLNRPCFATTIFVPGVIIPVLYLPFLTRRIIFGLTNDYKASQVGFYIAVAWAIIFSFLTSWLDQYGPF